MPGLLLISQKPEAALRAISKYQSGRYTLHEVSSGLEAVERLNSGLRVDLVLFDLVPGDIEVLNTLVSIEKLHPTLPVVLLSHPEQVPLAMEALRLGARESLLKPISEDHVERLLQHHVMASDLKTEMPADKVANISEEIGFIAAGSVMRKVRAQAELLSNVDVPILIVGESGSGKAVLAKLIHKLSARAPYRFTTVNCAALSPELIELELFGKDEVSQSGSRDLKAGKLALSHKGTILLDEFTEIPHRVQAKLLSILQDKHLVTPIGDNPIDIDVRVLATTNVKLEKALTEKKLREDFYYRLTPFTIEMPPLRERRDELKILLTHFMNRLAGNYGLPPRAISDLLVAGCENYSWPGNLCELESFVKRYLVMGDERILVNEIDRDVKHCDQPHPSEPMLADGRGHVDPENGLKNLMRTIKGQTEKDAISTTLEKTGWNRKQAARVLRISYRSLLYKIEEYHLTKPAGHWVSTASNGEKASQDHGSLAVNTHSASSHR